MTEADSEKAGHPPVTAKSRKKPRRRKIRAPQDQSTHSPGRGVPEKTAASDGGHGTAKLPTSGVTWMLSGIAVVISLLSLAATAFIGYQYFIIDQKHRQQTDVQLVSLQGKLEQQKEGLKQQAKRQQDSASAIQQQLQQIPGMQDAVKQLSKSVENVYLQLDRNLATWALEEVEQLVLLANHRLALNKDFEAAVVALRLADQRLLDSGDPGAIPVREQLAKDILQLQGIKPVDIAGMALLLGELMHQVDSLPLLEEQVRVPVPDGDIVGQPVEGDSDWERNAKEIWQDMQKLVRVQNVSEPPRPLLAPEQRYFLRENLKLNLASARLALLQLDQENYDLSIDTTRSWLQDYFDTASAAVETGLQQLQELAAAKLNPGLPDIGTSLTAVQALKKKRNPQ